MRRESIIGDYTSGYNPARLQFANKHQNLYQVLVCTFAAITDLVGDIVWSVNHKA